MSRGVNEVRIMGHLGKDPEVRYSQSGTAVANLSVATTYKPANGEEQTEWHRVVLFGKVAEVAGQYLSKGDRAYFEGRLQTRKWQNQQGQDQYSTEIVAHRMEMLNARGEPQAPRDHVPPEQGPAPETTSAPDDGFDDIPF